MPKAAGAVSGSVEVELVFPLTAGGQPQASILQPKCHHPVMISEHWQYQGNLSQVHGKFPLMMNICIKKKMNRIIESKIF